MFDLSAVNGTFQFACLGIAVVMLLWNTVEVGRNDAANLVNAVFGARVLNRRTGIIVAGVAVVFGAVFSSDVIDTARKGIFDPTGLAGYDDALERALAIYVSVYIVDNVLLYGYSAFGMPISTTAGLVFALLGAAVAIDVSIVNWDKAGMVVAAIVFSIIFSGIAAFFIQRAVRGAIRDRTTQLTTLLLHGGWVGGGLAAGLCYFLMLKGMKNVGWVKKLNTWLDQFNERVEADVGNLVIAMLLWAVFAIIIHVLLIVFRKRAAKLLFPVLAVLGMIAMGFAFGQNDLANCASPGLAAISLLSKQNVEIATEVPIASWMLLVCGLLLFAGMTTKNAERVTNAAVATGSASDHVVLWAPRWSVNLAGTLLRFRGRAPALAPRKRFTRAGKTLHYDTLRACVIMSVSASVIATASSLGMPVSTTYVTFAAVVTTGMADRIFQRGDAELKLGRAIWVVSSWFISAAIAAVAAGIVATTILQLGVVGIGICIATNLIIRAILKRHADRHAKTVSDEAYERSHPDRFALEDETI